MILDFLNNSNFPITDGVTAYKINAKTHNRIEVGYLALNGVLRLREPKKSLTEIDRKNINVYYSTFKVYSLASSGNAQISSRNIKSNVEELMISDTEYSIGYFNNSKIFMKEGSIDLVFWSQYEE